MNMLSRLGLFLTTAALAVVVAIPASGQTPGDPCGPALITDPAGDAVRDFVGTGDGPPAGPQSDVREIHMTYRGGKLYARMVLENFSKEFNEGSNEASWYVVWKLGEDTKYVAANNTAGDITYEYGSYSVTGTTGTYTPEGDVKGSLKEGAMGYLEMEVPKALGADPGKRLTSLYGFSSEVVRSPVGGPGLLVDNDEAPDEADASTKSYTVTPCPETPGGGGGGGGATPTPGPGATATPTPSGGGSGGSGGSGPSTPAGRLALKSSTKKVKLSKAKRAVSIKLKASESISDLRGLVYTGRLTKPKKFAEGGPFTISGTKTVRLKVKRKFKKGTYKLFFQGRKANGQQGTVQFTLKITK